MADQLDPQNDNLDSLATGADSTAPLLSEQHVSDLNAKLQRARLNAEAAAPIAPETAGKALAMSRSTGVPAMLAAENTSVHDKSLMDLALTRVAQDSPTLLNLLASDPVMFANSKDEIAQLQEIEQTIKDTQRNWDRGRGVDTMVARVLGNLNVHIKSRALEAARGTDAEQAYANALEQVAQQRESMPRHPGLDAAMARAQRETARGNTAGWWREMISGVLSAEGADASVDMLAESLVTMGGSAVIDAMVMLGAVTSDPEFALKAAATGAPFARGAKVWKGLSDAARVKTAQAGAVAAAAGVGTYEGAYSSYVVEGFGKEEFKGLPIVERARAAQKYAETKAQAEGLVNAAVSPLGLLVPGGIVAKAAGLGVSSAAGGGLGAYAASKSVGEKPSPEDVFLETVLELPGGAIDVGVATWAEHKAKVYNDRLKASIERARQMEETLRALSSSASNLASRERSPGTLAQFVDMAIEQHGTVPSELGIGARHLLEAVGEEGVADLRSKSERFDQQIDEAMQNDGEIVLDTSEFVEWSASLTPEQQAMLAQNVREHDGALTVAEAEEAKAELERFNQEAAADVADEYAADGDYIFEKFYADLVAADQERAATPGAARIDPQSNARYAELMKHAMVTIAKRAGMKPRELFDRFYGGVSATEGGGTASTKVDATNAAAESVKGTAAVDATPQQETHTANEGRVTPLYTTADEVIADLGDNVSSGGMNNEGVFTLKSHPDHVVKVSRDWKKNDGSSGGFAESSSLVERMKSVKSRVVAKPVVAFEKDGKVYEVQQRAVGDNLVKEPGGSSSDAVSVGEKTIVELSKIPQEHFNELFSAVRELNRNKLVVDPSTSDNLFYDPVRGFTLIDIGTVEESLYLEGAEDQLAKGAIASFSTILTNEGELLFGKEKYQSKSPEAAVLRAKIDSAIEASKVAPQQETYTTNEGRRFRDFFKSITEGTAGSPKTSAASVKVLNRERDGEVVDEFMKHSGLFDRHIEASIPGFRDIQFVIAGAIVSTFENADMLDIGASEGALVKTIAARGNNIRTVALDPNPGMADTFANKSTVPGAEYSMTALGTAEQEGQLAWEEEGGVAINYFKPDRKFDIVHEAMVFQFISNDRESQIARVAELLKDDGVAIFEQKFIAGEGLSQAEWKANEVMKDAFKEQFFNKEEMKTKAETVLVGMNQNMVSPGEFERVLRGKFQYVARFWKSGNFAGYIATNDPKRFEDMLGNIGDTSSPFSQPTVDDTRVDQSTPLRRGTQTLRKYGLKPGLRYKTREVAAALEARQREKFGSIPATFETEEERAAAIKKIAGWMAEEVAFEMETPGVSGIGWYSEKFQNALDTMAQIYPELKTDKAARDTMTLLIAITSDGQKVLPNFFQAMDIYRVYKETGSFGVGERGHARGGSISGNLDRLNELKKIFTTDEEMHAYLMQERTVGELKKIAKANGTKFSSAYLVDVKVPMAAIELGPKLGAFYANLMGAHGYLTMDRWWSRTFNRYRGTLLAAPTRDGLNRFKELSGHPEWTDDEVLAAVVGPRKSYEAKGFKRGTEIEKAANTIYKAAFENLEDSPFNGGDRSFMLDAVGAAQKVLKRRGISMSIADIQAVLWFYEKQLYGDLGARQSGKLTYEDAAKRVVGDIQRGDTAAYQPAGDGETSLDDAEDGDVGEEDFLEDARLNQEEPAIAPLPGAPQVAGATGPDPSLVAVAQKYAADNGIPFSRQSEYVEVDEAFAKRLADAYEQMQHDPKNPLVQEAYENLIRQTRAQYDALIAAGYSFTFFDSASDPYAGNPWGAMRDLRANKRMAVYGTYDGYGTGSMINIGLAKPGSTELLTKDEIVAAVEAAGGEIVQTAGHVSDSEPTLVIKLKTKMSDADLYSLAVALGQEAIAQRFDDETGTLQGPNAEAWGGKYNPDLFLVMDGRRATQVASPMLTDTGLRWADQAGVMRVVTPNDLFRAVHDAFGHGLESAGFRARGEENAWQAHRALFTGSAIAALTSETRGQNSWLNYGPYGEKNRVAGLHDTIFAEQKIGLMPEWAWTEKVVGHSYENPTIVVDGVERPTTNSLGRPIARTKGGLENFWRWFGDSKAVDADGKPLVVYHGTDVDLTKFDKGKVRGRFQYSIGFHFTNRTGEASIYADGLENAAVGFDPSSKFSKPPVEGGNVLPVYVRASNPLVIETDQSSASMEADMNRSEIIAQLVEAKRAGKPYDSVIIRRVRGDEYDGINVIVFEPTQIKSVFNRGTFDPNDPNILNQEEAANDIADNAAQENAQAEVKGLDMSQEARYARAEKMGFDTKRVWYHSTPEAGFRYFKLPEKFKTRRTGIFLSDDRRVAGTYAPGLSRDVKIGRPDEILADPESFGFTIDETPEGVFVSDPRGEYHEFNNLSEFVEFLRTDAPFETGAGMYEMFARLDPDNTYVIDWQGRSWSDGPEEEVWNIFDENDDVVDTLYSEVEAQKYSENNPRAVIRAEKQKMFLDTDDAARSARDMGYGAIEIRDVIDLGPYSSRVGPHESTVLVVFDPKDLRLTNAAFDPDFTNSDDVVAQNQPTKRKRGSFDVRSFNIALIDPNKTTTLHELGHMFFEMMVHLAAEPDAPKQIVDDVNAMLKFLEFPGSAADYLKVPVSQRRKSHETMAEHFEAYLRSGKAPTVELQGLFRTFAKWLIEAYGALTRMIGVGKLGNVDMDPELRAIFDRMLATDEAIEQSAKVRSLMPQFETAEQAGMTEEEFAEYQSRNSDVLDGAAEDLRAKLMRDMKWLNRLRDKTLRELTADAKAKRKSVRDEVTAEVDRMRVYRLMHFLKRGIMLDENGAEVQAPWLIESSKLNKAAVEALFPAGEVDVAKLGFGKYGMVSANGVDPGVIAGLFGYQSADEMVRDIVGAEPRGQLIDGMTEQRMLERYAEIATPEDLQKAADEAIASEAHTRMVATELAALDARQGKVSVLRKAAKYAAMGILGRRTVRNLRPDLSASAATRSRKDSAKALAAGKRDEAAAAKRNELLHVELERQGREAKREIEAFLRATKKVWKGGADKVSKSRDVELVMAARMVLGRYGIGSPAGMAAAANYVAMLAKYDGPHQAQVLQMTQGLPAPKEYKDLTLDEIRHVADIALGLYQMALDEKTMTIDGQKVAIDAVADRIVEGVKAKHGGAMPSDRATKRTPTPWDERVDALRSLKANLSRVEFWAGNMGAVFKEAILQPVVEAITKYRTRRSRMIKAYKGLLDEIAPTLTFKPITCKPGELVGEDGKPFTFSGGLSEIIHAILHTGNESNKRKLMLGRGWATENADGTLSHPGWDAFIARLAAEGTLTKEHFDFCQKVWDLLDSMKQDAQAAHKAVYGFYFHEITANELQTPFGTYRGGYVPAITDPRDVSESESKKDAEELLQSGNSFAFPTAPTGFTKQRVEYNRALHLDLRVLASHIDKVCRFTDVQPAVRDVAKLLMNKRVANALNRHDKKVINNMLIPWLQVSANQVTTRPGKDRTFDKFVSTVDSRTGMAIMFASVINTLQQATGFSAALVRTDENGNYLATSPEILRQIAAYLAGPKDYVALAVSRSAWLDDRMHNQTMEMRGAIDDMLVNANVIQKAEAFFARNAYFLQVAFQNMIDPIVFNAAYETAIARGATDKQARRAGEELIRTTLGTFAPEDVSAVEINTPTVRSMLKFYGFFNMWGNLLGSEASKALRQAGYMEPSKRLAFLWFAGLAMPAYVASLMAGNLPDDEDDEDGDGMLDEYLADFFGVQGRSLAAMVPGVGPITNFVVNLHNDKPYDDRLNVSPLMSTIESAVKSSDNLLRGEYFDEEVTKREVRDMSTLIAIATGIPTGPLAKMYGYEKDLESGRIEERGALGDVWGYATGK